MANISAFQAEDASSILATRTIIIAFKFYAPVAQRIEQVGSNH